MRETERLRSRRARARAEAVVSGEGGSPKMKNLMKQPIKMTTDSWPRTKPWVNDRLGETQRRDGTCGTFLGNLRGLLWWSLRRSICGMSVCLPTL